VTCWHENLIVVWSTIGSSGDRLPYRSLREQCIDCGKLLARSLSHSLATSDTPDVDEERVKAAIENERQQWIEQSNQALQEINERREREAEEWWTKYNDYLCTPDWQARRALVLKRSGGICEGCRERRATQVHHLNYNHVTNEFLWELVAICDVCHERVHG
jgi:hypothetical protein